MQEERVRASFEGVGVEDRKFFVNSKCILPISVGQPYHEGEKFRAAIELVDRAFKSCTILVGDVAQRHTMKIWCGHLNEDELYELSIEKGLLWLERSRKVIEGLTIPYKVMHWNHWLNHPDFQSSLKKIEKALEKDEEFKKAVLENVAIFLANVKKNNPNIQNYNHHNAFLSCLDYLKEECAILCLLVKEGAEFEVYPKKRNLSMAATYERFIKPKYPDLLRSVSLRFKKYQMQSTAPAYAPK